MLLASPSLRGTESGCGVIWCQIHGEGRHVGVGRDALTASLHVSARTERAVGDFPYQSALGQKTQLQIPRETTEVV